MSKPADAGVPEALQLRADDLMKMLACQTHIGANNVDYQMNQYVYKRTQQGAYIMNLKKTWEKVLLAARAICAVENPADVCVISARPYGQRGVMKFAAHTGATAVDGRFTPGTFTNQIQSAFREPRLLVVTDSRLDHQAIVEASYVNIPVIAFCNTDSPLKLVDIAIPCNNKGHQSLGLMLWLLAREVLIMKGQTSRELGGSSTSFVLDGKDVMVDLYFYRDPDEVSKQDQAREITEKEEEQPAYQPEPDQWGTELGGAGGAGNWPDNPMGGGMTNLGGTSDFNQITDWAMETQRHAEQWGGNQGPPGDAGIPPPAVAPMAQPPAPQQQSMEWGGGKSEQWN